MANSQASKPRLRWNLFQEEPVTIDRENAEQGKATLTNPGAYLEEEPRSVRAITGVATSSAPLIG